MVSGSSWCFTILKIPHHCMHRNVLRIVKPPTLTNTPPLLLYLAKEYRPPWCFTFIVWKQHSFRCKSCAPHQAGTCRHRGVVACRKGKQWCQPRQRPFWWCKHQCLCTWRLPEQTRKNEHGEMGAMPQKAIMIASMYHSWIVILHINL